jgi:hypothetical protein
MSCVYKSDHINILKSDFNTSMKENGIFPCPNHSCKLCIQPKHRLVLQIKHLMVEKALKTICELTNEQLLNYDNKYLILKNKNILENIIIYLAFVTPSEEIKTIDNIDFYNIDTEGDKLIKIIIALIGKNKDLVTQSMLERISICKSKKLKIIFKNYF